MLESCCIKTFTLKKKIKKKVNEAEVLLLQCRFMHKQAASSLVHTTKAEL